MYIYFRSSELMTASRVVVFVVVSPVMSFSLDVIYQYPTR